MLLKPSLCCVQSTLQIPLPDGKRRNDNNRNDNQDGNPRCAPSHNVALRERKHEGQQADGDERGANPVDGLRAELRFARCCCCCCWRRRRRRDEEHAADGDDAAHDGEDAKDPFPIGVFGDEAGEDVAKDAAERCAGALKEEKES